MTVLSLDHVNIRTVSVEETYAFYRDLLGMEPRAAPGAKSIDDGGWIYAMDGKPVVHVRRIGTPDMRGGSTPFVAGQGTGPIDHFALKCEDYDGVRARLEAKGVTLNFNDLPQINLRQIFVRDPNDILVELNFFEA